MNPQISENPELKSLPVSPEDMNCAKEWINQCVSSDPEGANKVVEPLIRSQKIEN